MSTPLTPSPPEQCLSPVVDPSPTEPSTPLRAEVLVSASEPCPVRPLCGEGR